VVIELGQFTRSAMEARVGSDLVAGIRAAVKHYSRRLESGRRPLALPSYFRTAPAADPANALDVPLGSEAEAALEREANRQHVTPQQILSHAVLTYLADMDSDGRPAFVDPPTV
jgi:hypothetical protein